VEDTEKGSPQAVWPSWTIGRAQKEASSTAVKSIYTDPDSILLPPSLAKPCVGWRRLGELYPNGIAEKLTVTPAEGMQTMHHSTPGVGIHATRGWNQIVSAMLNLILAKRKLFVGQEGNFLWGSVQPSNAKDGITRYNPSGKYVLRAFHQGDWKMVCIDDSIPVDEKGQSILPACTNPMEIWPVLMSKVLLKLWPGYEFDRENSSSGGTEILYSLCGWMVQTEVQSKSLLEFPYSKANRPSSPLLPFNPLTDSSSSPSVSESKPSALTSAQPTRPTSTTSSRDGKTGGAGSNKKKPSSASKKDGKGAVVEEIEEPILPPTPLNTEQLHAYASRKGELGWFNELVYSAPTSTTPSGLLFAYTFSSSLGISGFPLLSEILKTDSAAVQKFGAWEYEWDPQGTPLALALAAPSGASAPGTPGQPKHKSNASVSSKPVAAGKTAAAATPVTPLPAPVAMEEQRVDVVVDVPLIPLGPRFHCLLLDFFDERSEKSEIDARLDLLTASAAAAKGKTVGKTPPTPVAQAKKPAAQPGRDSISSAAGAKPGTASGVRPTAGGKKKEEEDRLKAQMEEEKLRAAAEVAGKAREEDLAKTHRAQARMEAWLRGEENMLAEEELAKTTPQLKVTDLLTGVQAVVRVDSAAEKWPCVSLIRSLDRYTSSSRLLDFWSRDSLRRPFSSLPPATLFVPDVQHKDVPLFVATPAPAEVDLPTLVAQGLPKEAILARSFHEALEYQSAQKIEMAVKGRRVFVQVEFQSNVQTTSGVADAEPLTRFPLLTKPGTEAPTSPVLAAVKGGEKKGEKAGAGKEKRPPSTSGKKGSLAPSSDTSTLNLGPLHLSPSPPPLAWVVQVERFEWKSGRREIVWEKRGRAEGEGQERRLELVELILPPSHPSTLPLSSSDEASLAPSSPSSVAASPKLKPTSKVGSASSKKPKDPSSSPSSPLVPGITYRLLVSSNFGYAAQVFSHAGVEVEEGKPGATAMAQASAAGEAGKKDTPPSLLSSLLSSPSLLDTNLPSTYVKQLEGGYPAQNPGQMFVLFKYVMEVPQAAGLVDLNLEDSSAVAATSAVKVRTPKQSASATTAEKRRQGQQAVTTEEPTPPTSSFSPFSKLHLPSTAAEANSSLAKPWLNPILGQAGAGVCVPVGVRTERKGKTEEAASEEKEDGSVEKLSTVEEESDSIWSSSTAISTHPQATLISALLFLQDSALLPFIRLEWVNNDTLSSWVVPAVDVGRTMQFLPNQKGYTLLATACVRDYQVFAGRFHMKLLTSRPLSSFSIEPLTSNLLFTDEYRSNTARSIARLLVSGTISQTPAKGDTPAGPLPQTLLHFSVSFPSSTASGLIARVWDLEESLEYPISSPPQPLTVVMGAGREVMVPVVLVSKEQRVLIELSFDPLLPRKEVFEHFAAIAAANPPTQAAHSKDAPPPPSTGITWTARFVSSSAVSVALDKSIEDDLLALKSQWGAGDAQRGKKARMVREAFLEQRAQANGTATTAKAGLKSGEKSAAPLSKSKDVPTLPPILPLPPTVLRTSLSNSSAANPLSLPVVLASDMEAERRTVQQVQLDRARVFKLSLEKQCNCVNELLAQQAEERDAGLAMWRNEADQATHEAWQQRNDLRRSLISQEVELAELKSILNQTSEATQSLILAGNYDEIAQAHTPFNDLAVTGTPAPSTGKEKKEKDSGATAGGNKKQKADLLSSIESGRFGLGLYLQLLQNALTPVLQYPAWKGGAVAEQAARKVQQVLIDALSLPIQQAKAYQAYKDALPAMQTPTTPSATARRAEKEKLKAGQSSVPEGPPAIAPSVLASSLWLGVQHARGMMPQLTSTQTLNKALVGAEVLLLAMATEQLDKAVEPLRLQAAHAEKDRAAAEKHEEEKSNSDSDTHQHQRTLSTKEKVSSKQAKLAAAALAASAPPTTDWAALSAWVRQVEDYHSLNEFDIPESHEEHPQVNLEAPTQTSPRLAPLQTPSRPQSAVQVEAPGEPVQWLNGGAEEEKSKSPVAGAYAQGAVNTLPPCLPSSLVEPDVVVESVTSVVGALGRESIAGVLAHLPAACGVHPSELLAASRVHSPVSSPQLTSVSVSPAAPLAVCGACFWHALIARSRALYSQAQEALGEHQIEVEKQQAAKAEEDARKAREEKDLADQKMQAKSAKPGSGSHKKNASSNSGSNKKTTAKH
jgi:hypothetical protein